MSMFEPLSPIRYKKDLLDLGIEKNKFYYISFFKGDDLDTRPIKITNVYDIYSCSPESKYLRTEAYFEYHFETEKTVIKKIVDKKFWFNIFGFNNKLVSKTITESWFIDFKEDWDSIDYYLVGDTPNLAKLRLIMAALKTPQPKEEKLEIINKAMDYYQEHHPDLVMKAMGFEIGEQFGDIADYSDKFLKIVGDLRND